MTWIANVSGRDREIEKNGELWSTNTRVYWFHFDPPKVHFFGWKFLALMGCCALKFSRVIHNDQGLLTHDIGTGVPEQFQRLKFKKIGPQFGAIWLIIMGLVRVTSPSLSRWRAARQAWQFEYSFWGGGRTPKIWEDKKRQKFSAISDKLDFNPE